MQRNWLKQRWDLGDGVTLTLEVEGPVPLPSTTLRLAQEASLTVERHLAAAAGQPPAPRSAPVEGGYRKAQQPITWGSARHVAEARQALADGAAHKAADKPDGWPYLIDGGGE